MRQSLYAYCAQNQLESLLEEWDTENNQGVSPQTVTKGSKKKIWWRCARNHRWQASVKARANGNGCPVCANRAVITGVNDLATTHPELAGQWHPEKNKGLLPSEIVSGTYRRVWWRCEKGHEWQAAVHPRTTGSGCPVCESKVILPGENDLASHMPELAAQWDHERNGDLKPENVSVYSNRRAWWRCELGHSWNASIGSRSEAGSGCPYCAGKKVLPGFNDLETLHPQIAKQWHPTLNGDLKPSQISRGSRKKIWWQCADGHVWQTVVYSRTTLKTGCPVCAGKTKKNVLRYHE